MSPTLLRVVVASLPTASRKVPPLAWMLPPTLIPLASAWPLATVRRNTRAVPPEPLSDPEEVVEVEAPLLPLPVLALALPPLEPLLPWVPPLAVP